MRPTVGMWILLIVLFLAVTGRLSNLYTVLVQGGKIADNPPHQSGSSSAPAPAPSNVIPSPTKPALQN